MNINIPPDSEQWLFADHGGADVAQWILGYPPRCGIGDELHFRFDGRLVARATVYTIIALGEMDGRRYLTGHKVCWLWSSFRDLRHRFDEVDRIERQVKRHRRLRRHAVARSDQYG